MTSFRKKYNYLLFGHFFVFFGTCLLSISGYCQFNEIKFEQLNVSLTDDRVHTIVQDSTGYMWFGSRGGGLDRYDGHEIVNYRSGLQDSLSLPHNWVESLYVDSFGTLWVGTVGGGLSFYDPSTDSFAHFKNEEGNEFSLSQDSVVSIIEDSHGYLWVGTWSGGLNRFDPNTRQFKRYQYDPGNSGSLSHNTVYGLFEDTSGTLWVGTGDFFDEQDGIGGLNKYDRASDSFTRFGHDPSSNSTLISNRVLSIMEDREGILWVGTMNGGLHTMNEDQASFSRNLSNFDIPNQSGVDELFSNADDFSGVLAIFEDRSGILWASSFNGGIIRFDKENLQLARLKANPNDPFSLPTDWIWEIYESHDGTLWFATSGGVRKLSPGRYQFFKSEIPVVDDNLASSRIKAILEDNEGNLWFGAEAGGLCKYDYYTRNCRRIILNPSDASSYNSNWINAIFEDKNNQLWIGTNNGICLFDRISESCDYFLSSPNEYPNSSKFQIWSIYEAPSVNGVLWLGSPSGLINFNTVSGQFELFEIEKNESVIEVGPILEDYQGRLLLGTSNGLFEFVKSTNTFKSLSDSNIPIDQYSIIDLYQDSSQRLWIGTELNGLVQYGQSTDSLAQYTVRDGLIGSGVHKIIGDDQNRLWLGTSGGISRFDIDLAKFTNYDLSHGILYPHIDFRSGNKTQNGYIYFGSRNGITYLDPDIFADNQVPPKIQLTSISTSPEKATYNPPFENQIKLPYNQRNISFNYNAFHYVDPARNVYSYKLEGADLTWRPSTLIREATYNNLSPQNYKFILNAANADGIWNERATPSSIEIKILPPWWRSWWAYTFYTILLVGVLYGASRWQQRLVEKRERAQAHLREAEIRAEVATERTRFLEELDETRTRFFQNLSHEFRTPLTLILGPVGRMLKNNGEVRSSSNQTTLETVHGNALRLHGLVNQLLDLSKLEAGHMELQLKRQYVEPFVKRLMDAFASMAANKGIELLFNQKDEGLELVFDEDKLEKILANLLSNAIKYSNSGARVLVTLSENLALSEAFPKGYIEIAVKDQGIGIETDALDHIFDRFYQVDDSSTRRVEGTGIGLALAKELVELHRGKISVTSQKGFGSEFIVSIPIGLEGVKPW